MEWKEVASWLWVALGALGGFLWKKQDKRIDDMETATEFKNYALQWQREDWAYDNSINN